MDVNRRINELDKILKEMRESVIEIYSYYVDRDKTPRNPNILSFHALIGGKNNILVDSVRTQFRDPNDFITRWLKGLNEQYGDRMYDNGKGERVRPLLVEVLRDGFLREYTFLFLERNFYRNLVSRVRAKPIDELWEIWIGGGSFVLGILIAPAYRSKSWTNDVSEIRRVGYKYWTIEHIMETGFVDPDSEDLIKFATHQDLFVFYKSILKKLSVSKYERDIFDLYLEYLKESDDINNEPLLIPEIRYGGLDKDHVYRVDFTILNYHTMDCIGFELSPSSSHMSVSGIKSGKTQKTMNEELSKKWDKEMAKRNSYFEKFGIKTITFTDKDLIDTKSVFNQIKKYLEKRDVNISSFESELDLLLK